MEGALNEINAPICVCVCVEIAGIIARGAAQRKLELWMSVALGRFSLLTLALSENERQTRDGAGYHGVSRGITAIGNLQLHRWKFISMASAIMSGHLFARPSGRVL